MIRRRPYFSTPLSMLLLLTASLAVAALQAMCASTGL